MSIRTGDGLTALSACSEDTVRAGCCTDRPWTRERVLAAAQGCVCGDREQDYGSPENSFGIIAALWSTYLTLEIEPEDVAAMMALLKIARLKSSPTHMDSWVDLAGYAACGGGIAGERGAGQT